jgi:hypothetical protein
MGWLPAQDEKTADLSAGVIGHHQAVGLDRIRRCGERPQLVLPQAMCPAAHQLVGHHANRLRSLSRLSSELEVDRDDFLEPDVHGVRLRHAGGGSQDDRATE